MILIIKVPPQILEAPFDVRHQAYTWHVPCAAINSGPHTKAVRGLAGRGTGPRIISRLGRYWWKASRMFGGFVDAGMTLEKLVSRR